MQNSAKKCEKNGLYHFHIPKTAGTSVSSVLGNIAKVKGLRKFGPSLIDGVANWGVDEWKSTDILVGHLGRIPLNYGFEYFIVLRDPMERLYSQFVHVQREVGHFFHETTVAKKLGFLDYINYNEEFFSYSYNTQARYLSLDLLISDLKGLKPSTTSSEETRLMSAFETCPIMNISLEKAIETIDNAAWCGTPDKLESLGIYLEHRYNIKVPKFPRLRVKSLNRPDITQDEIKQARKLLNLDEYLYRYVLSKKVTSVSAKS